MSWFILNFITSLNPLGSLTTLIALCLCLGLPWQLLLFLRQLSLILHIILFIKFLFDNNLIRLQWLIIILELNCVIQLLILCHKLFRHRLRFLTSLCSTATKCKYLLWGFKISWLGTSWRLLCHWKHNWFFWNDLNTWLFQFSWFWRLRIFIYIYLARWFWLTLQLSILGLSF